MSQVFCGFVASYLPPMLLLNALPLLCPIELADQHDHMLADHMLSSFYQAPPMKWPSSYLRRIKLLSG